MFHDMIHKEVQVYVDNMMVKSETRERHPAPLKNFLKRVKKYSLRLNPKKCIFGVTSARCLGTLLGLSLRLYFLTLMRNFLRAAVCPSLVSNFTSMSSTYTFTSL